MLIGVSKLSKYLTGMSCPDLDHHIWSQEELQIKLANKIKVGLVAVLPSIVGI